jgi:hypothetical protein
MSAGTPSVSPLYVRALDRVFIQLGGNSDLEADLTSVACSPGEAPEAPTTSVVPAEVPPPPKVETQADLQSAYEWLLRERKRLETYTNSQLARLQQEHAAMVARHYTNEQMMILRSQEMANKEDFLTRQTRSLQEQAHEQSERERALTEQREQLCRAHEEHAKLQESCSGVTRDTQVQQTLLKAMRVETAAIKRDRERAARDLEAMQRQLQEQRAARTKQEALLAARQTELDQRLGILQKSEEAVQRRLRELDDLEARLRIEIEEQEKQVAAERRAVETLSKRLRQRFI